MRLVCAFCGEIVRDGGEPAAPATTSHGMCATCADHFERLSEGMSLSEYLDTLPEPVLVIDEKGRVLGANRKIASIFGRDRLELRGLPPGPAFACAWSRLPAGCGGTVHCRECTIRRSLARLRETGAPIRGLKAWVPTGRGFVHVRVSMEIELGLVKVTVHPLSGPTARA